MVDAGMMVASPDINSLDLTSQSSPNPFVWMVWTEERWIRTSAYLV